MAVVRYRSLRRAGVELGIETSAISRAIASAESEYGVVLFDRTPQGVVLTEAGRVMRDHAEQQIDEARRLRARLCQLDGSAQRPVLLRCGAGFMADLVENGLRRLWSRAPEITLSIGIGATSDIVEAVLSGEADIGIAYDAPQHPRIRTITEMPHPLRVIVSTHKDETMGDTVDLSELCARNLALMPQTHGVRQLLDQSAERHGLHLRPVLTTDSISSLIDFARRGYGITFLPENTARALIIQGALRAVTMRNPSLNAPSASLFVRSKRRLEAPVMTTIQELVAGMSSFRHHGPD